MNGSLPPEPNRATPLLGMRRRPRRDWVQWLLVITLGGAIGLLTVYLLLCAEDLLTRKKGVKRIYQTQTNPRRAGTNDYRLSNADTEKKFKQVIEAQLAAFRLDDYSTAYTFAAKDIKAHVPLPAFEKMVKKSFPTIAHFHSVIFGIMVDDGQTALVNVMVSAESGVSRHYQYFLSREGGDWKISGVVEMKSDSTTA